MADRTPSESLEAALHHLREARIGMLFAPGGYNFDALMNKVDEAENADGIRSDLRKTRRFIEEALSGIERENQ